MQDLEEEVKTKYERIAVLEATVVANDSMIKNMWTEMALTTAVFSTETLENV